METFEVCAVINPLPIVVETETSEEREIAKDTQQVLGSAQLQGIQSHYCQARQHQAQSMAREESVRQKTQALSLFLFFTVRCWARSSISEYPFSLSIRSLCNM